MGSGGGYAQVMQETRLSIGYRWLGRVGYDEAHALQRRMVDGRVEGGGGDAFLAMEHERVLKTLYDPDLMPADLVAAHRANDRLVDKVFGYKGSGDEEERLAFLLSRYQTLQSSWNTSSGG